IATFGLAILTFIYVNLTRKILNSQSDPCVILTVIHDEERATILQLVARNIGSGLAHDVKFEFSRPIPSRAFGLTENDSKNAQSMENGPLIDGIPALGPGECRKIDWGQYGGLKAAIGDKPIIATCKFKKNGRAMRATQCPLDIESFSGTVAVETATAKSARQLEKIAKHLQQLSSYLSKLKVEVVSLPAERNEKENA
ncbi:MAG: hypothetical protein OEN48_09050, partial [Betaproteobacteria bacterium]|nr:hypothetical protein [Betaproteobacteria bacterium]